MLNKRLNMLVLAGHGTGLGAMLAYLKKFPSFTFLQITDSATFPQDLTKLLRSDSALCGMIIEHLAIKDHMSLVSNACGQDLSVVVMTRDPIDQLRSLFNTHLYWWFLAGVNASNRKDMGIMHSAGSLLGMLRLLLQANNLWHAVPLLPLFSKKAGQILFTDVKDLATGADQATMALIAKMMYKAPLTLKGALPQGRLFTRANRFINNIKPLDCQFGNVPFGLTLCPEEFCPYMGLEPDLAISYEKDEIGFSAGEFSGKVSFVAPAHVLAPLGLTKEAFIAPLRVVLEKNNRQVVRTYCEDMSARLATAEQFYNATSLTTEQFYELLLSDKQMADEIEQAIDAFAALLFSHQCQLPESWSSCKEFLRFKSNK